MKAKETVASEKQSSIRVPPRIRKVRGAFKQQSSQSRHSAERGRASGVVPAFCRARRASCLDTDGSRALGCACLRWHFGCIEHAHAPHLEKR